MSAVDTIISQKGGQDKYLTENPNFTLFKDSYLRYSQFAKTIIRVDSVGYNYDTFYFGHTYTYEIEKASDLLLNTVLEFNVSNLEKDTFVSETLYALVDYVELVVADQVIERLSGDWIYVYHLLHQQYTNSHIYSSLTNAVEDGGTNHILYLPIPFWFTKSIQQAFPLCALQNEPVRINLRLRDFHTISSTSKTNETINNIQLLSTVVDLTQEEQRVYVEKSIEYTISQVETIYPSTISSNQSSRVLIPLPDRQFVSDIHWVFRTLTSDSNKITHFFDFNRISGTYKEHTQRISLTMNGIKNLLPTKYFTGIQRMETYGFYNEEDAEQNIQTKWDKAANTIYCYTFGVDNNTTPNGFLSLNKFTNVALELEMVGDEYERQPIIFLTNYNILRIQNGYSQLLF